jgi:L-seryl-tRNA(Ser) seleniumtransferase
VAGLPAHAAALTPVINATGVLVHTNLGRAPLSPAAVDAVVAAAGSCDVEFDLATGARLREVGTTNRTTAADYAEATGPQTAFILKVHPSNFRIEGFTAAVGVPELAELGSGRGVPVVFDIGSGLLAPHPMLPDEPSAATALRDGADLVTASGDKLLGGPQAGLLLGRADLVRRLTRHPLARALRVDKLTLAALEATLAGPVPPVARALAADPAEIFDRAERAVVRLAGAGLDARVASARAAVGGGGAPGVELPSAAISLPESLSLPLRFGSPVTRGEHPAVVGRLEAGRLLLDLRSVSPDDDETLISAILAAAFR